MKTIKTKIFSLFVLFIVLSSCEAEKDLVKKSSIVEKSNSKISFSEFKRETGLSDFKTKIKIASPNLAFARNADGSYELSDFDIDTDLIKRLELDNNVTYSFRIYPNVVVSPNSFYNLTMDNKDGEWIQNVVELKPTLENFNDLLSGSTNDIAGQVSLLFTSNENGLTSTNNCYSVGIIGNNCSGSEISETCISKKFSTFCFNDENNVIIGEESDIFNDNNTAEIDYSFILNTNNLKENLSKFANDHVLLNNQIHELMENEINVNFENFPYAELTASQNEEEFKQALANAGVVNYSELGDLILSQSRNAINFQANNKDFAILKAETKQVLITDAIHVAVLDNPIEWTQEDDGGNAQRRTCREQYNIDRDRCNRDTNAYGALAILAFSGGPVAGGLACLGVMYQSSSCLSNATEDYNDCRN